MQRRPQRANTLAERSRADRLRARPRTLTRTHTLALAQTRAHTCKTRTRTHARARTHPHPHKQEPEQSWEETTCPTGKKLLSAKTRQTHQDGRKGGTSCHKNLHLPHEGRPLQRQLTGICSTSTILPSVDVCTRQLDHVPAL
eukprot:4620750-Pleurochrysis_carterae.AAC.1